MLRPPSTGRPETDTAIRDVLDSESKVNDRSLSTQHSPRRSLNPLWGNRLEPQERYPTDLSSRTSAQSEELTLPPFRQLFAAGQLSPPKPGPTAPSMPGFSCRQEGEDLDEMAHKRRKTSYDLSRPPPPLQHNSFSSHADRQVNFFNHKPHTSHNTTHSSTYPAFQPSTGSGAPSPTVPPWQLNSFSPSTLPIRPNLPPLPLVGPRNPYTSNEYALDTSQRECNPYREPFHNTHGSSLHPRNGSFSYGYQQPRNPTYPLPSDYSLQHDRSPFAAVSHHDYGPPRYAYDDSDGDGQQRKRRGNLPKEATDILKAWIEQHLPHPYPTEDQKQDLMKKTGLQMNQISNWFINARRRQVPGMINNARVETDVRAAQHGFQGSFHDRQEQPERGVDESRGPYDRYDNEFAARREPVALDGAGSKRPRH